VLSIHSPGQGNGSGKGDVALFSGRWLHAVAPTPAELEAIRAFGVPPELLTHVDDPDERPRVEHAGEVALVVVQCPLRRGAGTGAPFLTAPLSVFLLPAGVVTVAAQPFDFLDPLLDANGTGVGATQPSHLVLRIFWQVADAYLAAVRQINASVERLEDELKRSLRNEEVLGLLDYQKSLTYFATGMGANELVLERLQRSPSLRLDEHDQELLDDVRVEVRQAIEMVDISDNILSQMMDSFASIVSNNLNSVMKVLTSVTILLAIPTLVASLYGMNVQLPGARSALAFTAIMLLCAVLCGLLFVVFRRRNWL
jgi:magnesium transporter